MHDRIVVGFDGSPTSTDAVHWAAAEADLRGASVRVVSSYALPPVMDYYGMGASLASAAQLAEIKQACLDGMRSVVDACTHLHPKVGFDFEAVDRSSIAVLDDEAKAADLLVVGSSGAGAARAFLLGSVTAAVLHDSSCPVAVIPTHNADSAPAGAAPKGRIVVGVDGSAHSESAVLWAADEADRRGAELLVVHAWEYPYRPTSEPSGSGYDFARVDAALVVDRDVELAQDRCGMRVEGLLCEGSAVQALLDASKTADMVILGSRGRGGFKAMLLGSVAQAVTAHAACPVVVVRWPEGVATRS